MDSKAMATEDMAKEKDQSDKQCPTKYPTTTHKEKEKEKERQSAKPKDTQQTATNVANKVTQQRPVECQSATYKVTAGKTTTMQQSSGMDHP